MDTFVEQIIKKKKDGKELALIIGVWVAFAVVAALLYFFFAILGGLAILILAGALYGAWWVSTSQSREFEYALTNGSVDVDLIIAQRKRRRLVSVNGEKIEAAGPYSAAAMQGRRFDRRVIAVASLAEEGLWYFSYHSKKNGHTLVVFQPDDRVLAAFRESLPKLMQLELDRTCGKISRPTSDEE